MKTKAEEMDRICLWIILTGGFLSLLIYGLAALLAQPVAETITTHAPALNANSQSQEVNFQPRKTN